MIRTGNNRRRFYGNDDDIQKANDEENDDDDDDDDVHGTQRTGRSFRLVTTTAYYCCRHAAPSPSFWESCTSKTTWSCSGRFDLVALWVVLLVCSSQWFAFTRSTTQFLLLHRTRDNSPHLGTRNSPGDEIPERDIALFCYHWGKSLEYSGRKQQQQCLLIKTKHTLIYTYNLQCSLSPLLDNIRIMVIVWRLRRNIIRTALCWIVWHSVHSPHHTYVSSSYGSYRLGLSDCDSYAVRRGGCLELYYCNVVEWFWWDSSLIFDNQLVSFSALTLLVWSSGL